MENLIISTLSDLTQGMLYFSESENPFVLSNWGHIPTAALATEIATKNAVPTSQLRAVDPSAFFEKLTTKVDPSDQPMVENAKKIAAFYAYAQKNLSHLQVTRVEGARRIPIVITGYTPDGHCIAIQTQAVET